MLRDKESNLQQQAKVEGDPLRHDREPHQAKRRATSQACTIDGITSTWTIDGIIMCFLANGRKETVQTDSDLASVRQQCRR